MDVYINKNQKKLRCGFTTGTCAAAATKAALTKLLLHQECKEITIITPKMVAVSIPIYQDEETGTFYVIKDSGDDPDVTRGIEIYAKVTLLNEKQFEQVDKEYEFVYENHFILKGGEGIGRVTKRGLEQEVGFPAINKVPRKMIVDVIIEICNLADYAEMVLVEISAPQGLEIAKKTFNERLGIMGGISILGTSGIVEPMSEKALIDTIEAELKIKKAEGIKHLIMTPGNIGQQFADTLLNVEDKNVVKCSNYIGESIDLSVSIGFESILLVGNIGKLVKLAAGIMNTHSRVADGRMEILALYGGLCGAPMEVMNRIMNCITTEEALGILKEEKLLEVTIEAIMKQIEQVLSRRAGESMKIGAIIFSEKLGYLGETKSVKKIMEFDR